MSSATVTFEQPDAQPLTVALNPGESVLDGLLRSGALVPNSCRAGACQACLLQATAGSPPAAAQKGLKEALRARGFFLACSAVPTEDLTVRLAGDDAAARVRAVVREVKPIGRGVARVRLDSQDPFTYFPGQFVNVVRPADGLIRSYSLASLHVDGCLELHVRKVNGGQMSTWLHDDVKPGDALELRGPAGDCFYVPGRPEQPILLVGTGTGLAPLYAIARDAMRHGHAGAVRLYHGARDATGLYHADELEALAAQHANFTYTPCVMEGSAEHGARVGAIDRIVLADLPKLAGFRIFLCGDPTLVNALRKKLYLAGAKLRDIYADAFVSRATA